MPTARARCSTAMRPARHVGNEIDLIRRLTSIDKGLIYGTGIAHLFAGEYLKQSTTGATTTGFRTCSARKRSRAIRAPRRAISADRAFRLTHGCHRYTVCRWPTRETSVCFVAFLTLAACGGSKRPRLRTCRGARVFDVPLVSVRGTRDGDRLDAQAVFSDSSSMLTLEYAVRNRRPDDAGRGHVALGTRARDRRHGRGAAVTFLGGQDGPPSIGGTFELLDAEGKARYRSIPVTEVAPEIETPGPINPSTARHGCVPGLAAAGAQRVEWPGTRHDVGGLSHFDRRVRFLAACGRNRGSWRRAGACRARRRRGRTFRPMASIRFPCGFRIELVPLAPHIEAGVVAVELLPLIDVAAVAHRLVADGEGGQVVLRKLQGEDGGLGNFGSGDVRCVRRRR